MAVIWGRLVQWAKSEKQISCQLLRCVLLALLCFALLGLAWQRNWVVFAALPERERVPLVRIKNCARRCKEHSAEGGDRYPWGHLYVITSRSPYLNGRLDAHGFIQVPNSLTTPISVTALNHPLWLCVEWGYSVLQNTHFFVSSVLKIFA